MSTFALPPGVAYIPIVTAHIQSPFLPLQAPDATSAPSGYPYLLPNPTNRPRSTVAVSRFHIPGVVSVHGQTAPPANAQLELQLADGADVLWLWNGSLSMVNNGALSSIANFVVAEDLVTPIEITINQQPAVSASVAFDQDMNTGVFGSAVRVGGQIPNPSTWTTLQTTPGSVIYEIEN